MANNQTPDKCLERGTGVTTGDLDKQNDRFRSARAQCLSGIIAVGLATFICFHLHLHLPTVICLYLIILVLLAQRGNFLSSSIVSLIAAGCLDYYFIPHIFSFTVSDPSDILALITFLIASVVITQMVTRLRTLMQEQLKQSETLSEAQQLSHVGTFGWRVSTGDFLWSDETYRIFQCDRTTKPTMELVLHHTHPEDAALVKRTIEQASQDGKDLDFGHRLQMPDGLVKHVHVVAHGTTDKWGGFEFIGSVMDVSARKSSEEALRQAQTELADINRRTTMGEFAASIAHEVNQPLTGILMNLNASLRWLAGDPPNFDEMREAIQRAIRDGNRASEVTARIRALFKKGGNVKEHLDIN